MGVSVYQDGSTNHYRFPGDRLPVPAQWRSETARQVYEECIWTHRRGGMGPVSLFARLREPLPVPPEIARAYGITHDDRAEGWRWSIPAPGDDAETYVQRELNRMAQIGGEPVIRALVPLRRQPA